MYLFITLIHNVGELAGPQQVFFICPSSGGDGIVIQRWDMHRTDGSDPQMDIAGEGSMKYTTSAERLEVQNLEPTDEGLYVCTLTVDSGPSVQALGGCLIIYGEYFIVMI